MKKLVLSVLTFFSVSVSSGFTQTTGTHNGHEWVDLGLSVKWATRNVGAYNDLGPGDKFYYGETTVKSKANPTRMSGVSIKSIAGDKSFDAAAANWGGSWRIPTWQNFRELIDCCKWTEEGDFIKATSKINGVCIYFPLPDSHRHSRVRATVYEGYYWSSTFDGNSGGCARFFSWVSGSGGWGEADASLQWFDFSTACLIRPVLD
jgi:hypothetical protein